MSFNPAFLPIGLLFLVAMPSMFIAIKLLSKEISRERLQQVEDLSTLWKNRFPPKSVLTDKGVRIFNAYYVFLVVLFVVTLCIGLLTGFSNVPITFE